MAICEYCARDIRFHGLIEDGVQFCGVNCYKLFTVEYLLAQVPPELIEAEVTRVFNGPCPICANSGPNEIHSSYLVWSFALMTWWRTRQRISCISCARRRNIQDLCISSLLGWWALPVGFICTPMQIARNIRAIRKREPTDIPSEILRGRIHYQLMERLLAEGELSLDLGQRVPKLD